MCDVTNPLTGPEGATFTFGGQKGVSPEIRKRMEADMEKYAVLLSGIAGTDINSIPGTGAAGGLGAALKVFLHANMKSGIETVLDFIEFDKRLEGVDLVVTGEGRLDWQSAFGKVPSGIGQRCKKHGIPAIAIAGGMGNGAERIFEFGIESIMPAINRAMEIDEAMERAEELLKGAAERAFRMILVGMQLK
ncbi:glycerate kinase [Clostridium sp. Marseille-P2415]|uniref:glycerate kinase n=1 Tax=Clostridium sp. Marseille-P2415 TaxID=1805471 RepID=UPI003FA44989